MEQLIKKNCTTGEYENITPITSLQAIIDSETGESLETIISKYNHIQVPYLNNSKYNTRIQIPNKLRRKGLWITYISCDNEVITEWYNSDSFNNKEWGDSKNWVSYLDHTVVSNLLKKLMAWYKA